MPSQNKRASMHSVRSSARSEQNRSLGGRAERTGARSFHRVRTLEGTRVPTSNSTLGGGSSTTDLASLSSNGSLSTSGSRTNLSHVSHRARPRRTKSLKMTLNSSGSSANSAMIEAVKKERQKRSLSKPRTCTSSTRQSSAGLHEMELLQSTIDCSSNSHNTHTNASSDASTRSRIMDRNQNSSSSKLNATWDSSTDSTAASTTPHSPLNRSGTNNSIGVVPLHRPNAGSISNKLGMDDLDSSDDAHNEQADRLPQVLMAPNLSVHLSNGGASKRMSTLSTASSTRMLDDSNYSNTSFNPRPSTTSAARNFSTSSVHMARQFLEEAEDETNSPLETFKDEYSSSSFRIRKSNSNPGSEHHASSIHSSKHNNSSHRGISLNNDEEMGDYSFAHDASGLVVSDLEWNPEIQRQQHDEWRKLRQAEQASNDVQALGHSHNQFPDRPDLRHVDQTINLMDCSGGDVDDDNGHNESEPPPVRKKKEGLAFMSAMNSSMVDVWLDTTGSPIDNSHSDSAFKRQQKMNRKRNKKKRSRPSQYYLDRDDESWLRSCCREVFCSRYTVVLVLAALLAVLVGLKTKGAWGTSAPPPAAANATITTPPTAAPTTSIPTSETEANDNPAEDTSTDTNTDSTDDAEFEAVTTGRMTRPPIIATEFEKHEGENKVLEELKQLLEQLNLADSPALSQDSPPSPQYLALHWVAHLGADPDGVLGSSNHKLVHPEDGEEEDTDAVGDMMSNEDCIRLVAYALATLYYSTNGPDTAYTLDEHPASKGVWRKAENWMQPTPICEWHGVICEENTLTDSTVVTHLNLTQNELKGTIPSEVFRILFSLKSMDFSWNELTGTLPSEVELNLEEGLTTKPSLEVLWLKHNKLEGTFPMSWGKMESLKHLQLEHNHISGSLPPQINQLTNLEWLSLNNNFFTGSFPYIENMQSLEYLYFYGNKISGKLPYELFRIPAIVEIRGQNNLMSGTIPPEVENLRQLKMLILEDNAIEGTVPDVFDHLTNLLQIHLQNNKLEGPIPTTLGTLSLLDWLSLDTNAFTGTIPTELSNLKLLREFKCYGNSLSGPLPPGLCTLRNTDELMLLVVDCDKISDCWCCDDCR